MDALWLEGGTARMRTMPEPAARAGQALLQLRVAALGPADIATPTSFTGTPGTDAVATVLSSPLTEQIGQRVVLRHPITCGACRSCHAQDDSHCSSPLAIASGGLPGALSQTFAWPASHLVPVPKAVRDYDAVMAFGLAAGRAALPNAMTVNRLLVMGDGPRPPVVALALRAHQRMVHLAVADEQRAERLKRFELLRDPGGHFPLVVYCPCQGADLAAALRRVEPGGTILIDSSAGRTISADLAQAIARDVRLRSLGNGSLTEALGRLAMREVCESLAKVREESFPLRQADLALAAARTAGAFQVLVDNL